MDKEVSVTENFLPLGLYQEVNQYSKDTLWARPDREKFTTHHWWPEQTVCDSQPILIHRPTDNVPFYSELKNRMESASGLEVEQIYFYYGTMYSYFPWHNDMNPKSTRTGAITIYLNEHWDHNWGGYYMFKEHENFIRAIQPKQNLMILSKGGVLHCTTPVSKNADIRRSIQVYLGRPTNAK